MRCSSCERMTGLDTGDPEEQNDFEFEPDGEGGGSVSGGEFRLVRTCSDCGQDMKEATFEFSDPNEVTIEHEDDCESPKSEDADDFEVDTDVEAIEEGGGRYAKSFYGVQATVTVTCKACKAAGSVVLSDKIAASAMDEC